MGKKWGQHFLRSEKTIDKIVAASKVSEKDIVLEIGPGEGVLTRELCQRVGRVHAFEIDPELAQALEHSKLNGLKVHQGDFLKADLRSCLGPDLETPLVVVANLPYYITAPIVECLFWKRPLRVSRAILMMQEEVALRITQPATRSAGALSYFAGAFYDSQYLFEVSPGCFSPPPNVNSAVLELSLRSAQADVSVELCRVYEKLVGASFRTRRKQLGRSLRVLRADAADILQASGIDSKRRPESLGVQEFWQLARNWPK